MDNGGDAAEQVVRFSLEGFEVVARLTGSAAKNIGALLMTVLKQEHKTKGKARLTNMIKSGKPLKVFSIRQKDLKQFTEQAKRYGVLYNVLRNRTNNSPDAEVDIIAREEDGSKIQRIVDRFELGKVDKASIVSESEKNIADREEIGRDIPAKSKGQIVYEEAMGVPIQKDKNAPENPTVAKTDRNDPSRQNFGRSETRIDEGEAKAAEKKPSVRAELERIKAQNRKRSDAQEERMPSQPQRQNPAARNGQTFHQQPKKKKHYKER